MIKESGIVERLVCIADASRRADGSDIPLGEQCREAATLIAELQAERDRFERNRDMWKGQCERQAVSLTEMRVLLARVQQLGRTSAWRRLPNGGSFGATPLADDIDAQLVASSAATFKTGDRVRHVGREEDGTVTVLENGDVSVMFDIPNSRGNLSVGIYDANWFKTYPNGLRSLNITGLDTGAVKTAESSHSPSTLNAETE